MHCINFLSLLLFFCYVTEAAAQEIQRTILALFPDSQTDQVRIVPDLGHYLLFSVPSAFGDKPDKFEFLVKNEGVSGRGFEGDETEQGLLGKHPQ